MFTAFLILSAIWIIFGGSYICYNLTMFQWVRRLRGGQWHYNRYRWDGEAAFAWERPEDTKKHGVKYTIKREDWTK